MLKPVHGVERVSRCIRPMAERSCKRRVVLAVAKVGHHESEDRTYQDVVPVVWTAVRDGSKEAQREIPTAIIHCPRDGDQCRSRQWGETQPCFALMVN
jgi:hypothetical protein